MENDGAAALLLVDASRVSDFPCAPVYVLGAVTGSDVRAGASAHNAPNYASANYEGIAQRLYGVAKIAAKDVNVVQCYENFTGGVVMALAEHDFFAPEEANDFLRVENLIAPDGRLPLNTSGGHLGECYLQGLSLILEAARQVRGTSSNQVPVHDVALVIGGPMVTPASSLVLGSSATL
jgi:acetyl-CoA acetyltransferase